MSLAGKDGASNGDRCQPRLACQHDEQRIKKGNARDEC